MEARFVPHVGAMGQDTDSSEGEAFDFASSSPMDGGEASGPHAGGNSLSVAEFNRLQDELMALKLYNQELLGERRWLAQAAANNVGSNGSTGGPTGSSSGSARLSLSSLSSQMKVGTGAISAFGSRGVASLQSSLSKAASEEKEALRAEAESIKSRIRATLEEVEEFQVVAKDAQQVTAQAVARAESLRSLGPVEVPGLEDIRAKVIDLGAKESCVQEQLQTIDDELFRHLVHSTLRLSGAEPAGGSAGNEAGSNAEVEEDEDTVLMKQKIKVQSEELDRLLEIFHKQQEQLIKLQDQISGKEEDRNRELQRQVKEKLKDREKQVEGLVRQLETSEEASRQSVELRNQLRDFAEQAVARDTVLVELRSVFEYQAQEKALFTDRLTMVLEDLAGLSQRRLHKRRQSRQASRSFSVEASPSSRAEASPSAASSSPVGKLEVTTADVEVQADLDEDGLASVQQRQLQERIEDIRIEKALLEKRAAREMQELQSLVRSQQQELERRQEEKELHLKQKREEQEKKRRERLKGTKGGSWIMDSPSDGDGKSSTVPADVEHHDISSDASSEEGAQRSYSEEDAEDKSKAYPSAGLLYEQRVAELEAQSELLKQQVESLHDVERSLRQENKERNDLIAILMQKAKLPDAGKGDAQKGSWWSNRKSSSNPAEDARELNRVIEETTEDNIRLRNDIKIMADQLRIVLIDAKSAPASAKQGRPRVKEA